MIAAARRALARLPTMSALFLAASMVMTPTGGNAMDLSPGAIMDKVSGIFNIGALGRNVTKFFDSLMPSSAYPNTDMAIWAATRHMPLPQELVHSLIGAESAFDPNASPDTSDACGLTQMISTVLYEKLYNYGEQYGFNGKLYVERISSLNNDGGIIANYRLRDPAFAPLVHKMCTDPYFSTVMGMEHLRDTIYNVQTNLGRQITANEAYMGYVFGANGGTYLIRARERQPHASAAFFVNSAAVRANHNLFYETSVGYRHVGRGRHAHMQRYVHVRARSVGELFDLFKQKVGDDPVPVMAQRDGAPPVIISDTATKQLEVATGRPQTPPGTPAPPPPEPRRLAGTAPNDPLSFAP